MKKSTFALVDCNNFFVSCERVFNPKLLNKPAMVLSSNDGCVVARSQEVKSFGIPMGIPVFQIRDKIKRYDIQVLSSNFYLYGDMSWRVMSTLEEFTPDIEIYSVDEAFLQLSDMDKKTSELKKLGKKITLTVRKNTGIPVTVGIAPTKTLAKAAVELAKQNPKLQGVQNLSGIVKEEIDKCLGKLPVKDIWGIGYRTEPKLIAKNILTAKDFKYADRDWVKKKLGVMGERIQLELNGIKCMELNEAPASHKAIASTRSFGKMVSDIEELKQSVTSHVSRAAKKLRKQGSKAGHISVFISANHHVDLKKYSNLTGAALPVPTDYTPELIKYAISCLEEIYRPGFKYRKSGIFLTDILPRDYEQTSFFHQRDDLLDEKRSKVMENVDFINKRWKKDILKYASEGFDHKWKVKSEKMSPRYTTSWEELLKVS